MEPLIKFRLSIDRLNDKEFSLFRNKWISLLDRDIITSLIFNHFYKNKSQENNNYNLNIIMNSITNIIKQRKKSKSKQISIPTNKAKEPNEATIKLNELPSELIGEISSFLEMGEYSNFAQSNRHIYVSCNNPSRLVDLFLVPGRSHKNIRTQYPLIERLSFVMEDLTLHMMHHPNNNCFNHLNDLTLAFGLNIEFEPFIQHNNLINFKHITTLQSFNYNDDFEQTMDICKFLTYFPNLRHWHVRDIHFTPQDDEKDEILRQLLPELRVFRAEHCPDAIINKIVYLYGDQLESLSFTNQNALNIDSKNGFGKLRDLSLSSPSIKSLNNILNTTNVLQRLAIGMATDPNTSLSDKELESVILKLFKTQKILEYIGFDVAYNDWNKIATIVNNVLGKINFKDMNKKEFRIKYFVENTPLIETKQTKLVIQNLINLVNEFVSNDFMIEVRFEGLDDRFSPLDNKEIKNEMIKQFNDAFVCIVETNDNVKKPYQRFIITNKDCHICGYTERWVE